VLKYSGFSIRQTWFKSGIRHFLCDWGKIFNLSNPQFFPLCKWETTTIVRICYFVDLWGFKERMYTYHPAQRILTRCEIIELSTWFLASFFETHDNLHCFFVCLFVSSLLPTLNRNWCFLDAFLLLAKVLPTSLFFSLAVPLFPRTYWVHGFSPFLNLLINFLDVLHEGGEMVLTIVMVCVCVSVYVCVCVDHAHKIPTNNVILLLSFYSRSVWDME
jgi:hypothetical protein